MKAVLCPVCNGNGLVPNGFYTQTTGQWSAGSTAPETCKSCDGKGYVVVPEDVDTTVPYRPNICPACGRALWEPPLTGCPAGSHYVNT